MCRFEDITNFHDSLALSSRKLAGYFRSPEYLILLKSIYFSIFALYKSVIELHLQLHMSDDMQN